MPAQAARSPESDRKDGPHMTGATVDADATGDGWSALLAQATVDSGIELVTYVPDARLRGPLAALPAGSPVIRGLTREEECIAYAGGYAAAGGRASVWMQCSGLGNCLNALGSFVIPYDLGLPLVISMRGTLGEGNPSQVPMGRATASLLAALGIQSFGAHTEEDIRQLTPGVFRLALETGMPAALLLHPTLGGGRERA
jgi:sulfopyruvate decarboxylase subunit alpha